MFPPRGHARAVFWQTLVLGLAFALTLACPDRSLAQELVLSNLVVDNQAGEILVRFGVEVEGSDRVAGILKEGESLGLSCSVSLLRERSLWIDQTVYSADLDLFLRYDPLSKQFTAELPGSESPMAHADLAVLLSKAWSEITLDLGPWKDLSRGKDYRLMLEISLNRLDVPIWLKKPLFFWDWEAAPTTHYQLEFTY
ncbi:DUF4390 domain-containing protein [Desulfocurvibacter africanus]|uniref:DUF4390 domain-containing protein n=1 Tax=Desulfocurvibacter africanus TaxID=873 RepID=UPI00040EFA9C|nr:DUF4390 domain-containing protein [Desulfocurvibacter africanus]